MIELKCDSCGANLESTENPERYYCSYCNTNWLLDSKGRRYSVLKWKTCPICGNQHSTQEVNCPIKGGSMADYIIFDEKFQDLQKSSGFFINGMRVSDLKLKTRAELADGVKDLFKHETDDLDGCAKGCVLVSLFYTPPAAVLSLIVTKIWSDATISDSRNMFVIAVVALSYILCGFLIGYFMKVGSKDDFDKEKEKYRQVYQKIIELAASPLFYQKIYDYLTRKMDTDEYLSRLKMDLRDEEILQIKKEHDMVMLLLEIINSRGNVAAQEEPGKKKKPSPRKAALENLADKWDSLGVTRGKLNFLTAMMEDVEEESTGGNKKKIFKEAVKLKNFIVKTFTSEEQQLDQVRKYLERLEKIINSNYEECS